MYHANLQLKSLILDGFEDQIVWIVRTSTYKYIYLMSAYSNMSSFRLLALSISALLLGCEVCGNQWVATNLPCLYWPHVAISSNGTFVATVNNVGGIWLSYYRGEIGQIVAHPLVRGLLFR